MNLNLSRPLMVALLSVSVSAQAGQWTLEQSIQQAVCSSPELKKSNAEINARKLEADLSSLWPDPSIELRLDNKLGLDDNQGGYDLTDISISQDIPLSRLKYQRSVAQAGLSAAEYSRSNKALLLQNRIAKAFHELQFAAARLALAEKQRQLAHELSQPTRKNAQGIIVRYLSPLEKIRLNIIGEEAYQAEINAEGKYHEALTRFTRLLGIDNGESVTVSELHAIEQLPDLQALFEAQGHHVQLSAQQQLLVAASQQIELARSSAMKDPSISLIRSRDVFATGRDSVYGLMVNVEIPIHDRKNTLVSKARYEASQQRIELQRQKRELQISLKSSFTHLNHLFEQAANFQKKVLVPASQILKLTQKGFSSGELNVLSLVDANKTYFDARLQYLELLYQSWSELADVYLYAGKPINGANVQSACLQEGE